MTTIAYIYHDPLLDSLEDIRIKNLEVDRIYQDLGQRQQLKQLLRDCEENPPQCLIVRRLEELGDSIREISDRLTQIEQLGIEIIALEQPYNSAQLCETQPNELRTNLSLLLEEIQTNLTRRRLRQGHARNRLKVLPPPGRAPYGYRRGKDRYIVDRSTAPVVKDFIENFLLFGSLRGAVSYLQKKYGKKIAVSTGRRWLTSPIYRGDLIYHNQEIIANTHVPIISREEAAQIDRLLRRNALLPPRTASAPRSLAGLVVCQQCQSRMTITKVTRRNKPTEYLYLRPIACPQKPKCKAISYQAILEATIEGICLDLPQAVSKLNLEEVGGFKNQLMTEINHKKAIIEQINQLEAQEILDTETAQLRRYKLNTEITQTQAQLSQLPPVNLKAIAQTVSIPQFWLDLSEAERRFYFREFIREIQLIRTKNWQLKLSFIFGDLLD